MSTLVSLSEPTTACEMSTGPVLEVPTNDTEAERQELGVALLEAPSSLKRLVSPMLHYVEVQRALVQVHRRVGRDQMLFLKELTSPSCVASLEGLLQRLKDLPEAERNVQPTRHEAWVDKLREQVDYIPGETKAKRVIGVHELADALSLVRKMRNEGKARFLDYDYGMAVTRYMQIINVLADLEATRADENQLIDDARLMAYRNLSLAALRNWEWGRARRACDKVLERNPDDFAVRMRRAEASEQTGLFDQAMSDVSHVLASDLPKDDILFRRAARNKRRMQQAEQRSAGQMRAALAQSLAQGVFSEERQSRSDEPNTVPLNPRMQRTLYQAKARGCNEGPNKLTPAPGPATRPDPVLTRQTVEQIQLRQAALFARPQTQEVLERMRLEADYEEVRFLHRLQPFKLEVQQALLAEFGYDTDAAGLRLMERHVAAHMAEPAVGERGKQIMESIMGDIW